LHISESVIRSDIIVFGKEYIRGNCDLGLNEFDIYKIRKRKVTFTEVKKIGRCPRTYPTNVNKN